MSSRKCKLCGSSDIEVDPARGDAVCTNCGSVLEANIIVAEVQFEEGAHGNNAIGQFVSADSKGGATKFGASFHVGLGVESRELTLKKARQGITNLCNQLQLNQHCIDTACSFFKMALSRNLTKGRKNSHVHAACVYLTCRTEGTAHLLIDISDVLQICCYELGRAYLKLSQALCLNIPALDPCLYILRFAAKLEFGGKTQQVANTALRLVQRMKRDSIHSGRRPSGLCGAALLIAARLHDFGRSAGDIVKIVKVHESTLRKRLMEFGDTPSSALTLEEFMTVDLEEEQDPPSFKAARKKDKERLQKLMEEEAESITELQKEIEMQLRKDANVRHKRSKVSTEADKFIEESTLGTINEIIQQEGLKASDSTEPIRELGPDCVSMGLANSLDDTSNAVQPVAPLDVDLTFDDIDDAELDTYIMNEHEFQTKNEIWLKRNAGFLEEQKIKAEKLQKEKEEGKPEKKRRRPARRKPIGPTTSAGEAIEKIIQEKKISSKINYDVLKSLNATSTAAATNEIKKEEVVVVVETSPHKRPRLSTVETPPKKSMTSAINPRKKNEVGLPVFKDEVKGELELKADAAVEDVYEEDERQNDYYEDDRDDKESKENGILDLLRQHRNDGEEDNDDYYGAYEEEEY